MGKSRYEFFEEVWNDDIQHTQKGILHNGTIRESLDSYDHILYKIPLGEQYRPDLIAHKFYGDGKLYWVLVYINDINDSPQGFETNRTIKIPSPTILGGLV